MALPDINLCLSTRSQDCSLAKIKDDSEYGVGGADARNAHAQYLLPYKMDENQKITLLSPVTQDGSELTSLEWTFPTPAIGAYRFIYIFILPWNGATAYEAETVVDETITEYADIVYTGGSVYKAIANNTNVQPGVTSGWENSWVLVTDMTSLISYTGKETIIVHIHNDIVTCKFDACVRDYLDESADIILKGLCDNLEKILPTLKVQMLLDAAESNNWQEKQTRSEVILTEGLKKFCKTC